MSNRNATSAKNYFFVRVGSRHHRIDFARIRYLEARKSYCRIFTPEKSWIIAVGISQLEAFLPPGDFCRIHRSYIVGLAHVDWFENSLLRIGSQDLPIGDAYRAQLREKVLFGPGEAAPAKIVSRAKRLVLA